VPLLTYGKHAKAGVDMAIRKSLADIGQTVAENFATSIAAGESFLNQIT